MAVPPEGVEIILTAILKSFAGVKYSGEEANMTPYIHPEQLKKYNIEDNLYRQLRLCEDKYEYQKYEA